MYPYEPEHVPLFTSIKNKARKTGILKIMSGKPSGRSNKRCHIEKVLINGHTVGIRVYDEEPTKQSVNTNNNLEELKSGPTGNMQQKK